MRQCQLLVRTPGTLKELAFAEPPPILTEHDFDLGESGGERDSTEFLAARITTLHTTFTVVTVYLPPHVSGPRGSSERLEEVFVTLATACIAELPYGPVFIAGDFNFELSDDLASLSEGHRKRRKAWNEVWDQAVHDHPDVNFSLISGVEKYTHHPAVTGHRAAVLDGVFLLRHSASNTFGIQEASTTVEMGTDHSLITGVASIPTLQRPPPRPMLPKRIKWEKLRFDGDTPVSYTHLTLPTILLV